MIRAIVTHECPGCESLDVVKNERDYKGAQGTQSIHEDGIVFFCQD